VLEWLPESYRGAVERVKPAGGTPPGVRVPVRSPSVSSFPIKGEDLTLSGACRGAKPLCVTTFPHEWGTEGVESRQQTWPSKDRSGFLLSQE